MVELTREDRQHIPRRGGASAKFANGLPKLREGEAIHWTAGSGKSGASAI